MRVFIQPRARAWKEERKPEPKVDDLNKEGFEKTAEKTVRKIQVGGGELSETSVNIEMGKDIQKRRTNSL